MKNQSQMGVTPDVQDEFGNWKKSVCLPGFQWKTLSYQRWNNVTQRCKPSGSFQKRNPSYVGCRNDFKGFQEFVEWSRQQVGYDIEGYHLDKDLLIKGNKVYGPNTCVFIPGRINYLLNKRRLRGKFPIGVYHNKITDKYVSQCSFANNMSEYLGCYDTPESAFQAYKSYKENLVRKVAEEYKNIIDPRAYQVLMNYQVEITD